MKTKKNAWCEFGDIDHEGHDRGWKLAKHMETIVSAIADRITQLIQAGWTCVRVVTDHGWLLVPGNLPKTDLPSALVENKWGRCAILKEGATSQERLFPWFWNRDQLSALADGVSCYRKGEEYAHGGLSLQECLTLELVIQKKKAGATGQELEITDIVWKGMRCTVAVDGDFTGLCLDIRKFAGKKESSIILKAKEFKTNGTASVVVTKDNMEGQKAHVVILDGGGALAAQAETTVGEEEI